MIQNEKHEWLQWNIHDTILYAANSLMIIVEHTFWKNFTSNCNKLNKCL